MGLLDSHLEQITTSARAIGDLEFPPSKIFTNALLGQHEITTLIRDTEPHERSLFTLDPNISQKPNNVPARRSTLFPGDNNNRRKTFTPGTQRQSSTVAKVLGNDMLKQIQQSSHGQGRFRRVNIEVMLQAAEKLCGVYPVAGARDRIAKLRSRHSQIAQSVSRYEGLLVKQQANLDQYKNSLAQDGFSEDEGNGFHGAEPVPVSTDEYLRSEEEEIKELEARKKALEDRIAEMEKDLGGLMS